MVEGFFKSESEVGSREFHLRLFSTSSIASLQNIVKLVSTVRVIQGCGQCGTSLLARPSSASV